MDGFGIAAVSVGAVFAWGGLKGFSPLRAFENVISGKNPNEGQQYTQLTSSANSAGNSGSSIGSPATGSKLDWIKSFLNGIGAPDTPANESSISNWISRETPWPPVAKNNPLNTTQNEAGATDYNSVGVKNYPDPATGLRATVTTLENGLYDDILMALRSGQGLAGRSFAGLSKWSGGGYSSV